MEAESSVPTSTADTLAEEIIKEVGVPEDNINLEKSTEKELSWENIAAEIAAEENEVAEPIKSENGEEDNVVEAVIHNEIEEENFVAKSEAGEQEFHAVETPALVEEVPEEIAATVEEPDTEVTSTSEKIEESIKEAVVEISELKADETEILTETVENMEYTVVESEEVETHEMIEEHLSQDKSSETVVILNDEQSTTEVTIEQLNEEVEQDQENAPEEYTEEIYLVSKDDESIDDPNEQIPPKPAKRRGRKPISDIPLHVLGRDITKPTEGVSNGGRTMPKPRLGVKVPYRNLTSQIVSKQEIEKEIMDRFKQKQNAAHGDMMFARRLTQRLAKKLIPTEKEIVVEKTSKVEKPSSSTVNAATTEIKNNSDLIAILEGDDDEEIVEQKEVEPEKPVKLSEREIALQQLAELPGKPKIVKKIDDEKRVLTPQSVSSPRKSTERKNTVDVEPRLKTGMVIKTYTRKRKSPDLEAFLPQKKTLVTLTTVKGEDGTPGSVYVTKSSRIIKRKVIWDPDEIPHKSPNKNVKTDNIVKSPSPTKPVEKKEQKIEKPVEKRTPPSPIKKVIDKGSPLKKPKRLTEVDRLLMDEGAVNMLYDVKNNDEATPKKKAKSVISLDKAHKELLSKANVIRNDLQQNSEKEGQKSLRNKGLSSPPVKKDITPSGITRKKSKDSSRSSVHSPPASPAYHSADASRIIRRHSSSSFSSGNEMDDEDEERITRKRAASESLKKKAKVKPTKEVAKNNNTVEGKGNSVDKNLTQSKSFTATRRNKVVTIKLQNVDGKCYLNDAVLKELTASLKEYGSDNECHVVSIISDNNESFCEGLDYLLLVEEDEGARKKMATEWATLVKDFLRCLLNFPKVLAAGIQGDCVGLGVTMLPLFDFVIATDTSTFCCPYADFETIPEAGFLLTSPHINSHGLASELLYTSQAIKGDDAFRRGLVTRLCWPEKYQQEYKTLLSQVASQPLKNIIATKQQLRQNLIESVESQLSSISKTLIEYWTSEECQKNFCN